MTSRRRDRDGGGRVCIQTLAGLPYMLHTPKLNYMEIICTVFANMVLPHSLPHPQTTTLQTQGHTT